MTNLELLQLDPQELYGYLFEEYSIDMPIEITSAEDLILVNKLNLTLVSYESYLNALLTQAEICVRNAKRNLSKAEHEDMVDRKKIINNICEIIKHQREALSRSFTIYTKTLEELRISEQFSKK